MTTDGRDARWTEHRAARRKELVSHALRAIRVHGASVGMDAIASRAGTSKTVIYRHFGDRAGLYEAVVDSVHSYIHAGLAQAFELSDPSDLRRLTADLADAYLGLVERDPEIYRFIMTPPEQSADAVVDPVKGLPSVIGDEIAEAVAQSLDERGLDSSGAATWGHGLIGYIRAVADYWMSLDPRPPRAEIVAHVSAFFHAPLVGATVPATYSLEDQQ